MTEREFFNELAELDGFYLTSSGQVRLDVTVEKKVYSISPILALANLRAKDNKYLYGIDDWEPARKYLNLSLQSNLRITEAEDNSNDCDLSVRKKLLKACKL